MSAGNISRSGGSQFSSPVDRWRDGDLLCTKCGHHKAVDEFNTNRRNKAAGYSSWCKACLKVWRLENREALTEKKRQDYLLNREQRLATNLAAQRRNKAASNARSAKWRKENPDRRKDVANSWVKRNPSYNAARTAHRLAAKMRATPSWADKDAIQKVYDKAAEWGMWVDHVVPLVSKIVCGLHCEANLQLLVPDENIRKGNKHWPDMPGGEA